jgi:5-methylcytosine-specific restriction endonuclease McrA
MYRKRWERNHPAQYEAKKRRRTIGRRILREHGITPLAIAERDGWRCHRCHRPVSKRKYAIDHITPKSLGGSSTWANLALIHPLCNSKKGNWLALDQLRLF